VERIRGAVRVLAMAALSLWGCGGQAESTDAQSTPEDDRAGPMDVSTGVRPVSTGVPPEKGGRCEPVEPSLPPPGDPGMAGTQYGPLMGGSATAGNEKLGLFGTAAAVTVPNGWHLFLIPTPTGGPAVDPYISIVVPNETWSPGVYTRPLTGAIQVTTADSCVYRLDSAAMTVSESVFRLEVTASGQAAPVPPISLGGEYYLRGELSAELPSLQGRPPLQLRMRINAR